MNFIAHHLVEKILNLVKQWDEIYFFFIFPLEIRLLSTVKDFIR